MLSYSYCFSDIVKGNTNNAAATGLEWDMTSVLPPQAGLTVGGIVYRYSVSKNTDGSFSATVQNEDAINGGYVFRETDNWDGLPGNTIYKQIPFENIPKEYFGTGSIATTGDGQVYDPFVTYAYTYDECYDPLSNPECPGWAAAFYQYLLDNGLLNKDAVLEDEFAKEFIDDLLEEREEVSEKVEDESFEEESEESERDGLQESMAAVENAISLSSTMEQAAIYTALTRPDVYAQYKKKELEGGEYLETVILKDKKINDNRGAAARMGLAQDQVHENMVSSQYKLTEN